MANDELWEALLGYLNTWAVAHPVAAGIEVTFDATGGSRTITLVCTPEDWDDYWSMIFGIEGPAQVHLRSEVTAAPADLPFLVYKPTGYEWEASETPAIPTDPYDDVHPEPGGQWVTLDAEGNVTSRFADGIDLG